MQITDSSKPLAGRRILVTRARKQAAKLSSALRRLGAIVIEIPSIEIRPPRSYRPLDAALRRAAAYDWLILTSVNGVESLFQRADKLDEAALAAQAARDGNAPARSSRRTRRDAPPPDEALVPVRAALANLEICAIGPATKAAIEQNGLKVDVVPDKYVAESVVAALAARVKGKKVLLVRARVARDVIPRELRRAGAEVDVVEAYETVVPTSSRARLDTLLKNSRLRPDAITFTSSSTARNFLDLLGGRASKLKMLDGIVLASIGPVTSETLREIGLRADVEAAAYTMEGLVDGVVEKFTQK